LQRSRLDPTGGQATSEAARPFVRGIAAWTPKGFDWVYQRFIGSEKLAGYDSVRAVPFENSDPEFYERLKSATPQNFLPSEAMGEYLSIFSGQAYYSFDRSANVRNVVYSPRYR